jgi:dienelactone hydrolase
MAGSNKSEYLPVAPVLNRVGFTTLAVDQRSGGSRWGDVNETANEVVGGREFASAIPDLEAAIAFGVSLKRGPTAVWGSSYSAALGFIVAARNPEVKALLAFSPAEYIEGYSIQAQASKLTIPVFIASAPTANEVASAKALAQAVPHNRAQQYLPLHGVHGSSMLRNDVNPAGATEIWKQVLKFLDKFLPEGV